MFSFNNKTSIFSSYALVSVVGFAGLWFGAKGGESLTAVESFLAFYGFFSTTVVFYVLASQKSSIEHVYDALHCESKDRSREIESVYRQVSENYDSLHREIDSLNVQVNCCNSKGCSNEKVSY